MVIRMPLLSNSFRSDVDLFNTGLSLNGSKYTWSLNLIDCQSARPVKSAKASNKLRTSQSITQQAAQDEPDRQEVRGPGV